MGVPIEAGVAVPDVGCGVDIEKYVGIGYELRLAGVGQNGSTESGCWFDERERRWSAG